jgi:hypothetical protein
MLWHDPGRQAAFLEHGGLQGKRSGRRREGRYPEVPQAGGSVAPGHVIAVGNAPERAPATSAATHAGLGLSLSQWRRRPDPNADLGISGQHRGGGFLITARVPDADLQAVSR